ncbi:hypothetical protein [Jiangella sp. DSM 45060]|uniref:hypothetical protein n=1 Tax=Jiangella sp. DSM 45060 TaxID=1798224 RepID=UPI00087B4088|nr:hypothetical protein [Jiangella sp. DSM 45060]SDT68956.1 hypothetical protein SAMN04515669_5947 [Jiangella sp. DSM 45060]
MEPEEEDPALLVGSFVVEAGRRQAWPFVNLYNPDTDREVRLFIDTTFSVHPGWPALEQDDDPVLNVLDSLQGQTVRAVERPNGALRLVLDDDYLQIDGVDNRLTTHSPWSIGAP